MPALVVGCDEFLGAEVTRQLLLTGETVKGISLQPYDQDDLSKSRIKALYEDPNARHFEFIGDLINLDEEQQQQLAEVKSVYFLPEWDTELDYQEFVLHLSLKLLNICDNVQPRHLVFASHYSIYPPQNDVCSVNSHESQQPLSISSAIVHSIESLLHGFCAQKQLPCTALRLFELYGTQPPALNLVEQLIREFKDNTELNLAEIENQTLDYVHVFDAAKIFIRAMAHVPCSLHNAQTVVSPYHYGNAGQASREQENSSPKRPQQSRFQQHNSEQQNYLQEKSIQQTMKLNIPWQVYNLGTGIGTDTHNLLKAISKADKSPCNIVNCLPTETQTWIADTQELMKHMGLKPRTTLEEGLKRRLKL